jgi:hypothetical protein
MQPAEASDSAFDLLPRIVLRAGGNRPFVLSRQTPQRMIDRLGQRSVLDIWVGPAITLLSLGLLLRGLALW